MKSQMGHREFADEDAHAGGMLAPPSAEQTDALSPLLRERPTRLHTPPLPCLVVGTLIAIADGGSTPLVTCAHFPNDAAWPARTVVDLRAEHVGMQVALSFENGDSSLPIVTGVIRGSSQTLAAPPGQVTFEADGERMVVSASEQLVLRCGDASITLTQAGKVLIEGRYVSSQSTGVNRIKGGSIQLN